MSVLPRGFLVADVFLPCSLDVLCLSRSLSMPLTTVQYMFSGEGGFGSSLKSFVQFPPELQMESVGRSLSSSSPHGVHRVLFLRIRLRTRCLVSLVYLWKACSVCEPHFREWKDALNSTAE